MKGVSFFILVLTPLLCLYPQGNSTDVTFTEVMFNPAVSNNEFIEIFNLSKTNSADLSDFKIKYQSSLPDSIVSAGRGLILPPQSYAIILEGDYDLSSGLYSSIIPGTALVLFIKDNSFGSSGMSNTSDRTLYLLNGKNDTIDTYTYSANNPSGTSDEKITLNKNNSQTNWTNSILKNGTPGLINSATLNRNRISFTSVGLNPKYPVRGDDLLFTFTIKNTGVSSAEQLKFDLYNDINFDSTGSAGELIHLQMLGTLAPGDSAKISFAIKDLLPGDYQVIAFITGLANNDTVSDKKIIKFRVSEPPFSFNDIIINEIMYAPSPGEPEWLELFNRSTLPVNLKRWRLSDLSGSPVISQKDIWLLPGNYTVLCKDSTIKNYYSVPSEIICFNLPSLNNTGDAVVLRDSTGKTIDSTYYMPLWGGSNGRSLERISPEDVSVSAKNWKTSEAKQKATPGKVNSVTPKNFDLSVSAIRIFALLAFKDKPQEITVQIKNIGLYDPGSFKLEMYNDSDCDSTAENNEIISTFSGNGLRPADSLDIKFTITNISEGKNLFILKLTAERDDDVFNNISFAEITGVKINEIRNDVVINEIMYAPLTGKPEWIEIFNKSNKIINLKGYKIANHLDTLPVVRNVLLLNPEEYMVLSRDSSILSQYKIYSKCITSQFPTLSNSGDNVILLDSLNRIIDSLRYYPTWGGDNGFSLERISVNLSSNDPANWKTCKSMLSGTPGYSNSNSQKKYDLSVTDITFNPAHPLINQNVCISAKVKNNGLKPNNCKLILSEDTNFDMISDKPLETTESLNLASQDSLTYKFNFQIDSLRYERNFSVSLAFENDEDSSNNFICNSIMPGYISGSVVINEIMYAPTNGEPEWIELFNTSLDSVYLKRWALDNLLQKQNPEKITSSGAIIPPLGYIVLTKDSLIFRFHPHILSPVITVNLPSLNNDGDNIVLRDSRGIIIDSLRYLSSMGGQNGFSLERRSSTQPSNDPANWASSRDIQRSTPGQINSQSIKDFDLEVEEISFSPRSPYPGDSLYINVKVLNYGKKDVKDFSVWLFVSDRGLSDTVLLADFPKLSLRSASSILLSAPYPVLVKGSLIAIAKILFESDQDSTNNSRELWIRPGYMRGSAAVTEIMYAPKSGESEWFELFNTTDLPVNLNNWYFITASAPGIKNKISTNNLIISPGSYAVIAKDSLMLKYYPDLLLKVVNFRSLGNSSDAITVFDSWDNIIDSIKYNSSWGGQNGRSLEKYSPGLITCDSTSWAGSLSSSFSTPGQDNSIAKLFQYNRNSVIINEIMFDPSAGNCQFIELFNNSNEDIDLADWQIYNKNGNYNLLSFSHFILHKGEYFVHASDSMLIRNYPWLLDFGNCSFSDNTGLNLLKNEDRIILKDAHGNIIDSVFYAGKWHSKSIAETKNKSLERINPLINSNYSSNWSTSLATEGATPGKLNSIFVLKQKADKKFSVLPNPFSPDNDGFEDFTIINYNFEGNVSDIRIKIFDSHGRLVRSLPSQLPGSHGSIIFDGLDDQGIPLRIGIYILLLEELNSNSIAMETIKSVVVVARKL